MEYMRVILTWKNVSVAFYTELFFFEVCYGHFVSINNDLSWNVQFFCGDLFPSDEMLLIFFDWSCDRLAGCNRGDGFCFYILLHLAFNLFSNKMQDFLTTIIYRRADDKNIFSNFQYIVVYMLYANDAFKKLHVWFSLKEVVGRGKRAERAL